MSAFAMLPMFQSAVWAQASGNTAAPADAGDTLQ